MSENEKILSLRSAVVEVLRDKFPDLKTCDSFPGRFTLEALKEELGRAPSLRVSVLGVAGTSEVGTGEVDAEISMATYILTRDSGTGEERRKRDGAALALLAGVLFVVVGNQWGIEGAFPAQKLRAENLLSSGIDKKRIAFWAVTWTQKLRLGKDIFSEDGTMPSEIYASHAPEIGIPHKDKYRKIPDAL